RAIANGRKPRVGDALEQEITPDSLGAPLRERLIARLVADIVGVAGDLDPGVRAAAQDRRQRVQRNGGGARDLGARGQKQHLAHRLRRVERLLAGRRLQRAGGRKLGEIVAGGLEPRLALLRRYAFGGGRNRVGLVAAGRIRGVPSRRRSAAREPFGLPPRALEKLRPRGGGVARAPRRGCRIDPAGRARSPPVGLVERRSLGGCLGGARLRRR